jgi:hypothetical protein
MESRSYSIRPYCTYIHTYIGIYIHTCGKYVVSKVHTQGMMTTGTGSVQVLRIIQPNRRGIILVHT